MLLSWLYEGGFKRHSKLQQRERQYTHTHTHANRTMLCIVRSGPFIHSGEPLSLTKKQNSRVDFLPQSQRITQNPQPFPKVFAYLKWLMGTLSNTCYGRWVKWRQVCVIVWSGTTFPIMPCSTSCRSMQRHSGYRKQDNWCNKTLKILPFKISLNSFHFKISLQGRGSKCLLRNTQTSLVYSKWVGGGVFRDQ